MVTDSQAFPYADIIILALIAGFILLRLRSVLGSKSGADYFMKPPTTIQQPYEPVIQLDEKSLKPKPKEETDAYMAALTDKTIIDGINQVKAADPQFTATRFLQGARAAFEMVFDAFIKGDRQTLKMLMSDAVFQHFNNDIDQRNASAQPSGNKTETTLVSVAAKDITQAGLNNNIARLGVHFTSEQVTVVRGAGGDIVEGNPSELHHVEDNWVFERDVTSKNPNWKIVET